MKTYLKPLSMRRGSPVIHFVDLREGRYELGTYHDLVERTAKQRNKGSCSGTGKDYNAIQCLAISKELYEAFRKEAKRWADREKTANEHEKALFTRLLKHKVTKTLTAAEIKKIPALRWIKKGDKVLEYDDMGALQGTAGYLVVRDGKVISRILTKIR